MLVMMYYLHCLTELNGFFLDPIYEGFDIKGEETALHHVVYNHSDVHQVK